MTRRAKGTKPKKLSSESYAARVSRGRPLVSLSLPAEVVADLRAQAKKEERPMSAIVEDMLTIVLAKLRVADASEVEVERLPAVGAGADPVIASRQAQERAERPILAANSRDVSMQITRDEYETLKKAGARKKRKTDP